MRIALNILSILMASSVIAADTLTDVLIKDVPHVRQKPDFCGEACAEMYLNKLGHPLDQDDVFNASGLDPLTGKGCNTVYLSNALARIGFEVGGTWYKVPADSEKGIRKCFSALYNDLQAGIPSIVCMRTSDSAGATEHFRLVLGYSAADDSIIYNEPAEDKGGYRKMKLTEFISLWPLKYDRRQWTVIRLALKPGKVMKKSGTKGFTDADYCQHIMELKEKIPGPGFSIFIQKPFVVVGDESPAAVRSRSEATVKWAVEKLKAQYFKKDPDSIIDIWLFKDDESYRANALKMFGDTPDTPFGYSSRQHSALVMNIRTGGGTLIHEMVHPFLDTNLEKCPPWFNEGLASLYEQSCKKDGKIAGLTNWRLAGLQKAIKKKDLPSFKTLMEYDRDDFYGSDKGDNYAQSRYLCYYLQEKGMLEKYYKEFASNSDDKTGYESFKKVTGEKDMDKFMAKWQKYVLSLTFP